MTNCISCGKEIEDGSRFCEYCGAPQEMPQGAAETVLLEPPAAADPAATVLLSPPPASEPEQTPFPPQGAPGYSGGVLPQQGTPGYSGAGIPPQQGYDGYNPPYNPNIPAPPPRKRMPLGAKIALIVVLVLAVAVVAAWFVLNKLFAPEKTIQNFADSIAAQDFTAFSKVTCTADEGLELTEAAVAPFFALYSGDSYALDDFQESLTADLNDLKRGREAEGNGFIRLVEHNYFLFKRYEVELTGLEFEFETPLEGAAVSVGGQTVTMTPNTGTVTLLPGRYDITASYTDSRLGITFTYEEANCDLTRRSSAQYLPIPYCTLCLADTGLDVTSLTVNGVDYGPVQYDDMGDMYLAPLPENAEVTVTFNVGGAVLSDTMICQEEWGYFYPELRITDDLRTQLSLQAGQFLLDMASVITANDLSAMDSLQSQVSESSSFLNSMNDWLMHNQNDPENRIELTMLPTRILCEQAWGVSQNNGVVNFTCHLKVDYYYAYREYWDGEIWDEYEETEESDVFTFTFAPQNSGGWSIQNMDSIGYYNFMEDGAQTIFG